MGSDVLQRARNKVKELKGTTGHWNPTSYNNSRATQPKKALSARSWLIEFAARHGDSSPMKPTIMLPTGCKYTYYAVYVDDMTERGYKKIHSQSEPLQGNVVRHKMDRNPYAHG